MDIPELLSALHESIDNAESRVNDAQSQACEASSNAQEARSYANEAEDRADSAYAEAEDALSSLSTMRDELNELQERVDELLAGEETGEGVSDLQKDINKWKVKVQHLHANGNTHEQIAKHLEIGTFLVSRILELEQQAA